jgi:8-oxo-dGTP pyrophosphatase MutT (NUDIX family)
MAIKLSTMVKRILGSKSKSLPAAGVLVVTDSGEVLLTKRSSSAHYLAGCWSVPSGTLDSADGESVELCARREFFEETTHMIPQTDVLFFVDKYESEDKTYFLFLYRTPQKFNIRIDFEHDDWGWFNIDNLPQPLAPQILDGISKLDDIY